MLMTTFGGMALAAVVIGVLLDMKPAGIALAIGFGALALYLAH